MDTEELRWDFRRFDDLTLRDLYDALQLRCRVFVLEQGPYLDPDGLDHVAWHLLGRDPQRGELLAYLRILDPDTRFVEPSIGRVITAPQVRGQGLGRRLMQEGLARFAEVWPRQRVRISAQSRLEAFYRSLGFETAGEPYGEDGIPHVEMVRSMP
jgi:ElaA protein